MIYIHTEAQFSNFRVVYFERMDKCRGAALKLGQTELSKFIQIFKHFASLNIFESFGPI